MCGASLAQHGLLNSVNSLGLHDVDLSPVPAQHLASFASCVTSYLRIQNVSGCDLVSLFTSLKCQELSINWQSLGREETQALVQAMESGVEEVMLVGGLTLDIEALADYSGQGVCRTVGLHWPGGVVRYSEELLAWAKSKTWRVFSDEDLNCIVRRRGNEN